MTDVDFGKPLDEIGEVGFEDYFGFDERRKWYFPDGKQYIEYKLMSEGDRAQYQKQTSKDVRLFRGSGDASIKVDPAEERKILLHTSVTGWYVVRRNGNTWDEVPFPTNIKSTRNNDFDNWLDAANPKLISDLEVAIRKANPWMQNDMTVEQIDEEIDELNKLREEVVKRDEGKADS